MQRGGQMGWGLHPREALHQCHQHSAAPAPPPPQPGRLHALPASCCLQGYFPGHPALSKHLPEAADTVGWSPPTLHTLHQSGKITERRGLEKEFSKPGMKSWAHLCVAQHETSQNRIVYSTNASQPPHRLWGAHSRAGQSNTAKALRTELTFKHSQGQDMLWEHEHTNSLLKQKI